MKRIFPLLLLLHLIAISILGCKGDTAAQVHTVEKEATSKASNAQVKNTRIKEDITLKDTITSNASALDSVTTADDLVKKAMEIKPTAKIVSKPEATSKESEIKPVRKPKPNPVKSSPIKYRPKVEFDETTYDFGEITEGDIVKHKFTFTNTGKSNLSIEKATATCGCTKPSFPFIDIKPGETGYIGVTYNSVNKDGDQKPTITVYSNANPKETLLYLTGTVKAKEEVEKDDTAVDTTLTEMPKDTVKH